METTKDLFKTLDQAEKFFEDGSIKKAQKIIRDVSNQIKKVDKMPNKLRHKFNAALAKSRYYDDVSSFAANPKRNELIDTIKDLVNNPSESPKKQANLIHDLQTKWQLLDLSSRPAGREQWQTFNDLTNKAWEPCKEFFDELKEKKINNAIQRKKLIEEMNQFADNNKEKWPEAKTLIKFLNSIFNQWKDYAPVLDKDLRSLRDEYFEARKPFSKEIERQEKIVIKAKEALISKVEQINDEDNDVCIKKFNELKQQWKITGSAGRKNDNKLWDRFNKAADKFFTAKKEDVDRDLIVLKNLNSDLEKGEKTPSELKNEVESLTSINKTKDFFAFTKKIDAYQKNINTQMNIAKVQSFKDLYEVFQGKISSEGMNISRAIIAAAENQNNKTDKEKILYLCVKFELVAGLDSLKKDSKIRQAIQFEMLADKFNKGDRDKKIIVEKLLIDFFSNLSPKDAKANEKIWSRICKALDELSNDLF